MQLCPGSISPRPRLRGRAQRAASPATAAPPRTFSRRPSRHEEDRSACHLALPQGGWPVPRVSQREGLSGVLTAGLCSQHSVCLTLLTREGPLDLNVGPKAKNEENSGETSKRGTDLVPLPGIMTQRTTPLNLLPRRGVTPTRCPPGRWCPYKHRHFHRMNKC